jgi:hypothetical protein
MADRAKQKSLYLPDSTAGAFASTKRVFAQSSIKHGEERGEKYGDYR